MDQLDNEVSEYRSEMDECEIYSKKYWLSHDKYQAAFIKKHYLAKVLKHI